VINVMPDLLKRFPTLRYMIAGEGDDRGWLEKKASALGLSKQIIFTGRISEQGKASHYSLADAYVMPSYGEGGIVFLEAMACGLPVVGSKVDGSREALLDGQLGFRFSFRAYCGAVHGDTLQSVFDQNWPNIKVILAGDESTDNRHGILFGNSGDRLLRSIPS
jgi:glycosyltransferase involved in cell wall biosynthesis